MKTTFPSRQVLPTFDLHATRTVIPDILLKRKRSGFDAAALAGDEPDVAALGLEAAGVAEAEKEAVRLVRFVKGTDARPSLMTSAEIEALGDPFSAIILAPNDTDDIPVTLRSLVKIISDWDGGAYQIRKLFLVAEGAQISISKPGFPTNERLVFTWQKSENDQPDLLLSTVPALDDNGALLQLIGWSETAGAFQFYERNTRSGIWGWAGSSFHALEPDSRGQGPFDSHINGGLVMKELKAPWGHWHSSSASIPATVFPEDNPIRHDALFSDIRGAQELENIVRAGLLRWTQSRIKAQIVGQKITDFRQHMRQILWATSINLVSSLETYEQPLENRFPLPTSFFLDVDGLEFLISELGGAFFGLPQAKLIVDASLYRAAVGSLQLSVSDGPPITQSVPGDTHFAFTVPERALEDQLVLIELVILQVLNPRTALCMLCVDYPNPVFSPERAKLLQYVPDEVMVGDAGADFDQQFVSAVRASGPQAGTVEAEFLQLFDHIDLPTYLASEFEGYVAALQGRLMVPNGVEDILKLASSRRFVLDKERTLFEFKSTLALENAAIAHLAIRPDASIFTKSDLLGEGEF